MKTKDLVLIAMYATLFTVLEYVSVTFGLLKMPQGGSISISAVALIIASYHLGFKKSLIVSAISIIIMLLITPPYFLTVGQFMADYVFSYMSYSTAVLFKDLRFGDKIFPTGAIMSNVLRFMWHNIAGWLFFASYYEGNVLTGVMLYNASYMVPTMIISAVLVLLIRPKLKKEIIL